MEISQPDTGIFCTYCLHTPVPAVISCLLCEASLCDNHLRVHSNSPEHVLCDPTISLENWKCSIHGKILEYYCTEDSTWICVSCRLDGEHRRHQVKTLDEASEMKKKLRNLLQKLKTEEMEKIVQSLQEHRSKVDDETERVTALFRDLKKRVLSEISEQAERVSLSLSDVLQTLEIKKEPLSRKIRHLEELCNMTDPLTVLQEPDTGDFLCDTEDGDDEDRERLDEVLNEGHGLDVAGISQLLHTGLSDIVSGVNVERGHLSAESSRPCLQASPAVQLLLGVTGVTDILLDENTAFHYLDISQDKKTASQSENLNRPRTPERFKDISQVISSQSFSSGRHYWEVDVEGSDNWRVGMCYPSNPRKGKRSKIGENGKSWALDRWESHWGEQTYSAVHNGKKIPLSKVSSNRLGIDLDYEAGQISFYDLCDPIHLLHTFTDTFTEPLHAALFVYRGYMKISGGNSPHRA